MNPTDPTSSPPFATCPKCGLPRNQWATPGHVSNEQLYCCRGCAEGTGCTCLEKAAPNLQEFAGWDDPTRPSQP